MVTLFSLSALNRKLLRHKVNRNLLLRIAQNTTQFGPAGAPVLATVLATIQATLMGADPENGNLLVDGKIFVLGTSSGGRNAIEFAGLVAQVALLPHFVASIDASFSQADTDDRPSDNPQTVLKTPNFKLARIAPAVAGSSPVSIVTPMPIARRRDTAAADPGLIASPTPITPASEPFTAT